MKDKIVNRYEVYYRHKYLTEFAAELGIDVSTARVFIKKAGLPKLQYKRRTYVFKRLEYERQLVRDFVGTLIAIQNKYDVTLTFNQISRAILELRQRGVA